MEYSGHLPSDVFEVVRELGGRIHSTDPLEISCRRSERMALTLAGLLARSEVSVKGILLRRSEEDLSPETTGAA